MLKKINFNILIKRFFSSWFSATAINLIINNNYNNLSYLQDAMLINIILLIVLFIIYSVINKFIKNIDLIMLLLSYTVCSFIWLKNDNSFLFILAIIIIFNIMIISFIKENEKILNKIEINEKIFKILEVLIIIIPTFILIVIGCLRYYNLFSPNFDFGIFSNIFYNMKNKMLPLSTCERDYLLSHFAVHFSPILYLILPIYFLFSHPITLQIIQVLILISGIIPIIKIAKHYKLSNIIIIALSILYCFYPALSCGTFYDFHENCFLTPLLLWLFYLCDKKNKILMYIIAFLILLVKEDAFIYIVIFALYIILSRKRYLDGSILLGMSIIYFLIVSTLMTRYGLGIMADRYEILMYNNSGLIGVIKTIILNPGYVLKQLLSTPDKIIYILKLFLPLLFLPIITKNISRLILLCPLLLFILTDYIYMYDINFQYCFGIIAFLFYLTIINIKDIKCNKKYILSLSIICCLTMYFSFVFTCFNENINFWKENRKQNIEIHKILKSIPEESSVSASTFFVPQLSEREEIYEVEYHENKLDVDYVILDMRYEDNIDIIKHYINNNYKKYLEKENMIIILKK